MSDFGLLKTRKFLPLFIAQFGGAFNDNVFKNALVILITYQLAEHVGVDARILVTLAAGVFILPFFLFSAIAGQVADKFEKNRLIRMIKVLEICLMVVASLGFYLHDAYLLLFTLFLTGVQSAFFGPLKYSILPDLMQDKELIAANALVEAGTFIAILLGTIIGGALILKVGGFLWVSCIIIIIAVLGWACSLKIPLSGAADPGLKIDYNFFAKSFELVKHTLHRDKVFFSIIGISWFWLLGFIFLAQMPVYGRYVLGGNDNVVTLLLTMFSIGVGVGSLSCNKLLKGKISAYYAPWMLWLMSGAIFTLWYFSPSVPEDRVFMDIGEVFLSNAMVFISFFLIAVLGGVYIVPLYTIMQRRCEKSHRSRTVAANNILNALFMVAGSVFVILMLNLSVRITDIFLTLAIVNIPVGMLIYKFVK